MQRSLARGRDGGKKKRLILAGKAKSVGMAYMCGNRATEGIQKTAQISQILELARHLHSMVSTPSSLE
jgi:hypothetical protein